MRVKQRRAGRARIDPVDRDPAVAPRPPRPVDERRVVVDAQAAPAVCGRISSPRAPVRCRPDRLRGGRELVEQRESTRHPTLGSTQPCGEHVEREPVCSQTRDQPRVLDRGVLGCGEVTVVQQRLGRRDRPRGRRDLIATEASQRFDAKVAIDQHEPIALDDGSFLTSTPGSFLASSKATCVRHAESRDHGRRRVMLPRKRFSLRRQDRPAPAANQPAIHTVLSPRFAFAESVNSSAVGELALI